MSTVEVTATYKVVEYLINNQILFSYGEWEYLATVDAEGCLWFFNNQEKLYLIIDNPKKKTETFGATIKCDGIDINSESFYSARHLVDYVLSTIGFMEYDYPNRKYLLATPYSDKQWIYENLDRLLSVEAYSDKEKGRISELDIGESIVISNGMETDTIVRLE